MSAESAPAPALALSALLPEGWAPLDPTVDYAQSLGRLLDEMGQAESVDLAGATPLIGPFTEVERLLSSVDAQLSAVTFTEGEGEGALSTQVLTVTALEADSEVEVALVDQWRQRGEVEPIETVDRPGVVNRFTIAADRPDAFRSGIRYLIKDLCLLVVTVFSTQPEVTLDDEDTLLASIGVLPTS